MSRDEFWRLIADARGDVEALRTLLVARPKEDIVAFDRIYDELRIESYRWPLWGAAYLLNGGCSDDGFEYFRGWLIAQGRQVYEAALADPDSLAKFAGDVELELEEMLYVGREAYEAKTSQDMPEREPPLFPKEPAGTPWEEGNLEALFPKISAKLQLQPVRK